ncbi:hypothetical protein CEXT_320101 [Caerostris extrusa]|uniref:Uncharacterized protein n=1 Tax=Caerostris extrusa TaxID=172846 RepID=A0AAV4WXJ0_CAEEX|nr:hypothetical protein CEXT_320101 [Caerostris extrusa]
MIGMEEWRLTASRPSLLTLRDSSGKGEVMDGGGIFGEIWCWKKESGTEIFDVMNENRMCQSRSSSPSERRVQRRTLRALPLVFERTSTLIRGLFNLDRDGRKEVNCL